jgi:hypothetical protein
MVNNMITKRINTLNFEFHETCLACPEQYDVYLEDKLVGYVRLRWGGLSCDYPDVGGDQVYTYSWYGKESLDGYLGQFPDDDQRDYHLEQIAKALYNRIYESETVR